MRYLIIALAAAAALGCSDPPAGPLDSAGLEAEGWSVYLSSGRQCRGIPWHLNFLNTPAAAIALCRVYHGE